MSPHRSGRAAGGSRPPSRRSRPSWATRRRSPAPRTSTRGCSTGTRRASRSGPRWVTRSLSAMTRGRSIPGSETWWRPPSSICSRTHAWSARPPSRLPGMRTGNNQAPAARRPTRPGHRRIAMRVPETTSEVTEADDVGLFLRVLDETIDTLDATRIPYLFIGGIGSAVYGRDQGTRDIDVFVRPETARRILDALDERG